jgi:hypothetical protein
VAKALIIQFPMHRVKRRRVAGASVFRSLRDLDALGRAELRLLWACSAIVTLFGTALQLAVL